jgi:hypothetical protein
VEAGQFASSARTVPVENQAARRDLALSAIASRLWFPNDGVGALQRCAGGLGKKIPEACIKAVGEVGYLNIAETRAWPTQCSEHRR